MSETTEPVTIASIDLAEVRKMKKADLLELCAALDLPTDGTVKELLKRIEAAKLGGDRHHVHGRTLCPQSGQPIGPGGHLCTRKNGHKV